MAFLDGRQSSADYIKVFEDHLLPFGEVYYGKKIISQQDNAPIHTSKLTKTFFQSRNLKVMSWLACSPDFNPIVNVWGVLSRQVYNNGKQFHSKSDLENAIRSAWEELDRKFVKTLIKSKDDRCFKVIENKGNIISYY